jgi:hypothetical protein
MREVPLSKGMVALVDDEDYPLVCVWKWCAASAGRNSYAVSPTMYNYTGIQQMQHLIMGHAKYDHIDGNGLNNQKSNLRPCNCIENGGNRRVSKNNHSGFKGVYHSKLGRPWKASISHKGIYIYLGYFDTAEEAAHAYDEKAVELFGEFAQTNFRRRVS